MRSRMSDGEAHKASAVITVWLRPERSARQERTSSAVAALGRMRRPHAPTVSAASTSAFDPSASDTLRAFKHASRRASMRGVSPLCGVSSISAGRTSSGATPAWAKSESRRGLSLASTRRGVDLFEAIGDAPFAEVIGRHLHEHLVARQYADAVLAHLARCMCDDLVPILKLHAKGGIGQKFADRARKFQKFF